LWGWGGVKNYSLPGVVSFAPIYIYKF